MVIIYNNGSQLKNPDISGAIFTSIDSRYISKPDSKVLLGIFFLRLLPFKKVFRKKEHIAGKRKPYPFDDYYTYIVINYSNKMKQYEF